MSTCSHFFQKVKQHSNTRWGKITTPYNSVVCRTTFSTSKLKKTFAIRVYQSQSFWRNFGQLFFRTLLQFSDVWGHLFMHNSLKTHHSIPVGLRSGLGQQLDFFFFSHLDVNLLMCLESLSCCMTQFWPSLSCWTDGLTCVSRIFRNKVEFIAV